jgi:hypothetical protein
MSNFPQLVAIAQSMASEAPDLSDARGPQTFKKESSE